MRCGCRCCLHALNTFSSSVCLCIWAMKNQLFETSTSLPLFTFPIHCSREKGRRREVLFFYKFIIRPEYVIRLITFTNFRPPLFVPSIFSSQGRSSFSTYPIVYIFDTTFFWYISMYLHYLRLALAQDFNLLPSAFSFIYYFLLFLRYTPFLDRIFGAVF